MSTRSDFPPRPEFTVWEEAFPNEERQTITTPDANHAAEEFVKNHSYLDPGETVTACVQGPDGAVRKFEVEAVLGFEVREVDPNTGKSIDDRRSLDDADMPAALAEAQAAQTRKAPVPPEG